MPENILKDAKKRMEGAINALRSDLKGLRTGRASTALLESVKVLAYGALTPLDQVATITAPEPRLLNVQVWDQSQAAAVEKAIANSGLGLNPSSAGAVIRIPLPDLSEDRRKELVKVASQYTENARVAVRNVRRDAMDTLKKLQKEGTISEDDLHGRSDEVQKLTDGFIKEADEAFSKKEKDILAV